MGGVAIHAVFRDRGVLVGKRPAILCVATQAELIGIRRPQIVAGRPAMWIMAINTAHFAFA